MTLTDALVGPLLGAGGMGPRITYYDDASGERIEVSTVTLANWAAKTANLLRDEMGAGASLVQLSNPDPAALDRRRETEKVTRTL